MGRSESGRVGKRGTLVIPAWLRGMFGLEEGTDAVMEATTEGVLIRRAMTVPVEMYGTLRRAEFLLTNAVDEVDYREAVEEVRRLGSDSVEVPHLRPDAT